MNFPANSTSEVFRTWYRSQTPDGNVWAESSDPADMLRPGPDGVELTYLVSTVHLVTTPWVVTAPPEDPDGEMPPPCQPIGCDNGYHLSGCYYAEVDEERQDDTCHCGHPECGAC